MSPPSHRRGEPPRSLESGAIMLGAALVFVTLFRRLELGATLGYIVAGALIGPNVLGLIRDPEQLTSVTEIGIALLLFIVGLELKPSRLWRLRKDIFGLGLLQVVLCGLAISAAGLARARLQPGRGAGASACRWPVVDRAGAADAAIGQELNTPQRRAGLLDPAVPGPVDRPDDHDHRGDGARLRPTRRARRAGSSALYTVVAIVGLVLVGRFILNPLFRLIGRSWRARAVRRRRPVHRHRAASR